MVVVGFTLLSLVVEAVVEAVVAPVVAPVDAPVVAEPVVDEPVPIVFSLGFTSDELFSFGVDLVTEPLPANFKLKSFTLTSCF